jgi:hypothetical protein
MGGRGPAWRGKLGCMNLDVDCILERARGAAGARYGGEELRPMDVCIDSLRIRWSKVVREVRRVEVGRVEERRGSSSHRRC